MRPHALACGAVLLGAFLLVQVPPAANDDDDAADDLTPPITRRKVIERFASQTDCESYRQRILQDSAVMGSEAMTGQASSLGCVPADAPPPRP